MKRVYKYATGQDVPKDAVYLWSCKNGSIRGKVEGGEPLRFSYPDNYEYVWHYFLVEVKDEETQS